MKMTKIAVLLFATLYLGTAPAATSAQKELCEVLEDTATEIGLIRFGGVPLSRAIQIIDEVYGGSSTHGFMTTIVFRMYDLPAYPPGEFQDQAIREEANKVYMSCYRELTSKESDKE